MGPRKSRPRRVKDDEIRIRVTAEQKAALQSAADREDLELSTWLRQLGLKAAKQPGA